MTQPRPVDRRLIRDTLWRWFRDASGIETVWANQAAPQPAYPYASINVTGAGPADPGIHDFEDWRSDGELRFVGQRELMLSCQVHIGPPDNVDPDCDGEAIMDSVLASLSSPTVIEEFRQAGLALRDRGQPQNLALVVGSEWISRQMAEFRFGYVSVLEPETGLDAVGYFDKVEVSSTIDGLKNPGGSLELDDEIFDPNA